MKRLSLLIPGLLSLLFLCQAVTAQVATGIVYEDRNGNGKKERREPGIPGVSVSNGREVVQTDADGRYTLPARDDMILSVIKPTGYQVPVNELNQPQFFYIHKPSGSPELKYAGTPPTGELPGSVDFGLIRSEEPERFRAFIFGDPQPYNLKEIDYFAKAIVSEVEKAEDRVFGLSLGDIAGDNLDLDEPYSRVIARAGIPWYNVMGNHDMNYDATEDKYADEAFEAHFGPANYAFNYGKVHFIVLDNILYPDPRDGKGYWGGFREDQLEFVENDLKFVPKDYLVVVSFHIPLLGNGNAFRSEDRERMLELLAQFPHTLSLSAHTHYQKQHFHKGHHHYNVGTTSGDWYSGSFGPDGTPSSMMRDGTPKGYATLTFDGNQYVIDYKVAGQPEDYRMEIHTPKVVPHNARYNGEITVNFFAGGEKDTVEYRIDNGPWKTMQRVEAFDPTLEYIHHEWDYSTTLPSGRRPSHPILSSHSWKARIPSDLPVGEHRVEVRVKDMFGRTHTDTRTYRIQ